MDSPAPARDLRSRIRLALRAPLTIYLAAVTLARAGAVFLIPLYTRRLTPREYGAYAIGTSFLSFLPIALSLGLTAGISKAFFDTPKDADTRDSVGSIARGFLTILTVLAVPLALGVYVFWGEGLWTLTRRQALLLLLAAVGIAVTTIPDSYLRSSQRAKLAAALQLSAFLTSTTLGVVLVAVYRRGLDGVIEALAASACVTGIVGVAFTFLYLRGGNVVASTRSAVKYSLPLIPHSAASWVQMSIDRWVLQVYAGPDVLGTYYLALQLATPISMVIGAFNDAETPRMGATYRDAGIGALGARLWSFCRRYVFAASLPFLLALLGAPLLPMLVGPKFVGAAFILPFIGLSIVLDAAYYPAANIVFFSGKTHLIPMVTVIGAIVGFLASVVLLPTFGVAGLLAARLLASLFRSGVMTVAAVRVSRRPSAG